MADGEWCMETIGQIKEKIKGASPQQLPSLLSCYEKDERSGVQAILRQAQKKLDDLAAERARLEQMRTYEHKYEYLGPVCGIDEAGRGPLAGPVVAAAVILPQDCEILYLNDSKKLSPYRRELLYDEIITRALSVGVGIVGPLRIDEINILQSDYEAMCEALGQLRIMPAVLLNDAVTIPQVTIPQVPIIKGDAKSVSIAAASVIAKVTRDRIMLEYDDLFPDYGFAQHKGYGSAAHIAAIRKYGPCPIHRKSFITHFI